MQPSLRMAHLVVGAVAIAGFLITGMLMSGHEPPVMKMGWDQRLLFNSRHIYLMSAGLVNLAMGVHYLLPAARALRVVAILGSLLALVSALLLFFAFFAEPMAGRLPGGTSGYGLFALFGGVLLYALANLVGRRAGP
ncbi:MAG TPA: hypothetical protein VIG03_01455 [Steroidobacteraceae bacterium]|jgi:hypothetical protein